LNEARRTMQIIPFELRAEFITLDRLLKATGLAMSGGGAKAMVAEGKVQVDGRDELRKTAKLRAGQVVSLAGTRIRLMPPGSVALVDAALVAAPSTE
jgi:ribosome-associated protein